jgi:predicted nucleotidyltransferase
VNLLSAIQQKLTKIKPDLVSKYHVSKIGLFGSVVRDDFNDNSDVDILVEFSEPIGVEFIDLANELELFLDKKIDLVSKAGIKPSYFQAIAPEIVYV